MLRTALPLAMLATLGACGYFEAPSVLVAPEDVIVHGVHGHLAIAADGSRIGVAHLGGGVSVIDVPTGEAEKLDETATAIAVGDTHGDVWFAGADGRILRQGRGRGAKPWIFAHPSTQPGTDPDCLPIDGLTVRGEILAWSSSATGQGGLYNTKTEEELLRLEDLTWISHPSVQAPLIRLTPDGQSMVFRKRGAPAQHETILGRWGIAPFAPHPSSLDPVRAANAHWIYHVTREEGAFQIKRLAVDGSGEEVVDADARGGLIANLILSPSGHYLLEGDPLERGTRLYKIREHSPVVRMDIGADNVQLTPVGFCVLDGAEHVLTRGTDHRGVVAWDSGGDSLKSCPFPWLLGQFVQATGPLPGRGAQWALVSPLDGDGRPGPLNLRLMYDVRP